jgi:Entner-Doudoroff aldolase
VADYSRGLDGPIGRHHAEAPPMTDHPGLARLQSERAVAIIRTDSQEVAAAAMDAAVRGGFRVIEFTLGCPGAYDLVREFKQRDEDLLIGVGTVLEVSDVERSLEAGAEFVVSPTTDEAVIRATVEAGAVAVPGGYTSTELHAAHRAGAQLQKLFPAPALGPAYARMVLGPLPFLRLVPTSGVTPDNAADWLDAGVFAVGFVASLFDTDDLKERRYDAIELRARQCLASVAAAS